MINVAPLLRLVPAVVYSLSPSTIGARCGYVLSLTFLRRWIVARAESTLTDEDIRRAQLKDERETVRQAQWAYSDADMTKHELRDYYKTMKGKPKCKNRIVDKPQFADL